MDRPCYIMCIAGKVNCDRSLFWLIWETFWNKADKMSNKHAMNLFSVDCIYCNNSQSLEEVIALTNDTIHYDRMLNCNDELQFNVDQFIIHTKYNLCSLENGLIEKGVQVYVCGLLSKLLSEDDHNDTIHLSVKQIGKILRLVSVLVRCKTFFALLHFILIQRSNQ